MDCPEALRKGVVLKDFQPGLRAGHAAPLPLRVQVSPLPSPSTKPRTDVTVTGLSSTAVAGKPPVSGE